MPQVLLQRSQFAVKELGYFLRAQGVVASAIKTLEFATASFAEQEPHGLFSGNSVEVCFSACDSRWIRREYRSLTVTDYRRD
jgi:hypothetical protein